MIRERTIEALIKPESFYTYLAKVARQHLEPRYYFLGNLHTQAVKQYIDALHSITDEQAQHQSSYIGDTRTRALVVGHIAGWEEWQLQAISQLRTGNPNPDIMRFQGYKDLIDRSVHNFTSSADFNEYLAEKQKAWSWDRIRQFAIDTTTQVYGVFTSPNYLKPELLDNTVEYKYKTPYGNIRTKVGFYFPMVTIAHMVETHKRDIYTQGAASFPS